MRYLTKSRFKLALECPAKLYYTGKKDYPNEKLDDLFLESLAEGGFQVGALAKAYNPGGIEITDKGYDAPLIRTAELMKLDCVTIFEAAFKYNNLFIRADIVIKRGNTLELIEVKSKSFREDDSEFIGKKGFLVSGWKPYLYDIAFQKYVLINAYPEMTVVPFLMLADKNKKASVDGLNQKFFIARDFEGKEFVEFVGDVSEDAIGEKILSKVNVSDIVNRIFEGTDSEEKPSMNFKTMIHLFGDSYEKDQLINTAVGEQCHKCEFTCSFEDDEKGFHSGYRSCWERQLKWSKNDFLEPHVFEIWDNRRKSNMVNEGIYHMKQLRKDHLGDFKPSPDGSMTRNERQWLQVVKTLANDVKPHIDIDGLKSEMRRWSYPLHFIDFETSMVAIPFNKGRKPYEGIAFQFSHHMVNDDGQIVHAGEYINADAGFFPNFDFIRALEAELGNDNGTIFRYANHENTFLAMIWQQLNEVSDNEIEGRTRLMDFIESISHSTEKSVKKWKGERDMVDILDLVRKYFYQIDMKGSNSIKVVLPAIFSNSDYIKNKYSLPNYGAENGMVSRNFKNQRWYETYDSGQVKNPYKLLEPVFNDISQVDIENIMVDETIADGGAAMTAYARMQFTRMGDVERSLAKKALLRYCELDTLAMVMIWEYWNYLINNKK